ncbi:MAG: PepSY domain-containing protein [Marinicaulis sp.]|nr:PepSY domain-containing protein [Marinicaulis sp.]
MILVIQIVLWMASGVIMSWFHIETVRGEHTTAHQIAPELDPYNYVAPGGVIAREDGALELTLRHFQGIPVYEVITASGATLYDAESGDKISPIDEDTAREIAERDFDGDGEIVRIALLEETPQEYRRSLPVWRADFNDKRNTRLYISPETGKVISRRNDIWRLYDFFWMLHIMDYDEREDFNNPLVKIASAAGLIFVLTGLYLLFVRGGRKILVRDTQRIFGHSNSKPPESKTPPEADGA